MINKKPIVTGIFISRQKGCREQVVKACLIENQGLEGDIHAGHVFRQVSLLSDESSFKPDISIKKGLCTERFVPNLTTSGILLHNYKIGTSFKIGQCLLEITQIGKRCFPDCILAGQTEKCRLKTDVVFARIIAGGEIETGSIITLPKIDK